MNFWCEKKGGKAEKARRQRIKGSMKAIIFDLGGVYFTNGSKFLAKYIHENFGKPESDVAYAITDSEFGLDYRKGRISRGEYWKKLLKTLAINEDFRKLEKVVFSEYMLIPGTREVVKKLRKKYKVVYLSNNVKERVDFLRSKFNFEGDFDFGIMSNEVGLIKPDPKIYELILERLEVGPEKCVFIDDREGNLRPARELGIKTILFKDSGQLVEDLKKLGIKLD
ncbi:MAG: hypothetical protein COY38_02935 [Candidatus Aenigmarchaeota archaeon CG_4_10_14_0_8_um_filter_37_24]|nr:HAD family phosphatase [Candidatus Aenigmarchaeota archaeon]PIV69461.1 MAG: hypothetical protein COS07_00670 [Candidatus Aenigmarchaeota archaeon CG01_land_8_20_14_3_00_37_9]PIX50374.1 MAG: hypothetical protein COZ52_04475 [Candidatus Aenigmarchaeota archaeon CG_4_8_14_3_um_filter_37_24]PIY36466.1 MAG: hypothetical protein COZ04_00210 [Candidatus Aenigmarchaeota archaeon CG_4_10_14_3_um_filter_37_21]PIZ35078.1 MAG: hypothetical protein COY38_02935 [Candidatus Aenigmarchaeota archaeon CG_4_10